MWVILKIFTYGFGCFVVVLNPLNGKANGEARNPSKYLLLFGIPGRIFDGKCVEKSSVDTGAYYKKLKKMVEITRKFSGMLLYLPIVEKLAAVLCR